MILLLYMSLRKAIGCAVNRCRMKVMIVGEGRVGGVKRGLEGAKQFGREFVALTLPFIYMFIIFSLITHMFVPLA